MQEDSIWDILKCWGEAIYYFSSCFFLSLSASKLLKIKFALLNITFMMWLCWGLSNFNSYLYNYKLHTTLFLTTYYYWWWNPLLVFKRKHLLPSSALLRIVKLFMKKEDKPCWNSLINWRHQTLLVNFDIGKKKKFTKIMK